MRSAFRKNSLLQAFWREWTGEAAYAGYLAHHRRHHGQGAPLNRADYFRCEQERRWNGIRRCC